MRVVSPIIIEISNSQSVSVVTSHLLPVQRLVDNQDAVSPVSQKH